MVKYQLRNVRGMMEFKNYHLTTTIIIFVLGKNHEQLLKLAGEIMGGKSAFLSLKESINMYLFQ